MRRLLLAVMLILPSGSWAAEAGQTAAARAVESVYPDYVIVQETELDRGMVDYLRQRDSAGRDRSLTTVSADFDGNGLEDHAAIVRSKDHSDGGFVIVLQTSKGEFRAVKSVMFRSVPDYVVLIRVEAGQEVKQTEAIEAPMKIAVLRHPAIELVYFEKAAVVFYWNPGKAGIADIATSD